MKGLLHRTPQQKAHNIMQKVWHFGLAWLGLRAGRTTMMCARDTNRHANGISDLQSPPRLAPSWARRDQSFRVITTTPVCGALGGMVLWARETATPFGVLGGAADARATVKAAATGPASAIRPLPKRPLNCAPYDHAARSDSRVSTSARRSSRASAAAFMTPIRESGSVTTGSSLPIRTPLSYQLDTIRTRLVRAAEDNCKSRMIADEVDATPGHAKRATRIMAMAEEDGCASVVCCAKTFLRIPFWDVSSSNAFG